MYIDAVNKLPPQNPLIQNILQQGILGREIRLSVPEAPNVQFTLKVSPEQLPKGENAEFDDIGTSTEGTRTIVHL